MSRTVSVGVMAAAVVLGSGLVLTTGTSSATDLLPPPSAGPLPNSGSFAAHTQPGRVTTAKESIEVRYTFDDGTDQPIVDTNGTHLLRPLGQNGGRLALVPQGGGLAVSYPKRCTKTRQRECPRAILEGIRDDALNPGRRTMAYGASILMTHADLADGANVVQKGYSVGGVSQFKLQVDHRQGFPSCVVAGRTRIYRAEPRLDVADGTWHELVCARRKDRLVTIVDGVERASVPVPPSLSIANAEPLRVGGKGTNDGNDQYAGQIDNVFVMID